MRDQIRLHASGKIIFVTPYIIDGVQNQSQLIDAGYQEASVLRKLEEALRTQIEVHAFLPCEAAFGISSYHKANYHLQVVDSVASTQLCARLRDKWSSIMPQTVIIVGDNSTFIDLAWSAKSAGARVLVVLADDRPHQFLRQRGFELYSLTALLANQRACNQPLVFDELEQLLRTLCFSSKLQAITWNAISTELATLIDECAIQSYRIIDAMINGWYSIQPSQWVRRILNSYLGPSSMSLRNRLRAKFSH